MKENRAMKTSHIGLVAIFAALVGYGAQTVGTSPQHAGRPALEFEVVSRYDFDTTIEKVKETATAEKYGVQGVHEISKILTEKGFPRERLTIVEVCNPGSASASLNADIRTGLHMPCPVMVYEKAGKVMVMTFDTRTMATMYEGGAAMTETGGKVYAALRKILDSVDASKAAE
jgi:uncharacterized protein (DUF302 family)